MSSENSNESSCEVFWDEVEKEAKILECLFSRISLRNKVVAGVYLATTVALSAGCCHLCARNLLEQVAENIDEFYGVDSTEEEFEDEG